ncbi:hydroxymethylglutaryl-CoA lyase [Halalkalibacterium halodurans]|uniref:hydroxymethylglutaryl-CoA lyase n=1 Tax=Halalkalibacterium halodurans TaxID=86665 RepID=UPI002AA9D5FB|nr:hydroxymethylglutaryl-CoA lyase [Halalkalibacterium halodurans]MDY7220926.1 hydroxymethylglutaryl-CoA lyase [Halalkalibacterium halodurans]MDY7240165.1 hydroxymethylglutaryl-CoA lyase [Halalkalibacterium halodurans]
MLLPSKVTICEVAPRDGFQAEQEWIPTKQKLEIIKALATTGIQSMEITSFVHPKAIPQLKDASEVVERSQDLTNIRFRALVPNARGAERAIKAGIKKIKLMLSATDSHSISNANCTVEKAQNNHMSTIELAHRHNIKVGGSISVAFGCPYEGKVPIDRLISIVDRYNRQGVYEVSLADTTGMADPVQVYETLGVLKSLFPQTTFTMHFHNTRGMALANVFAALQQGVLDFDSSIAGLGGCPYAPGASGNVATEDLIHMLERMGIETGVDLEQVILVAKETQKSIGHDGGSYMLQAGPCSALSLKPTGQQKIGK